MTIRNEQHWEKLSESSEELLKGSDVDLNMVADKMRALTGAAYVALNRFVEDSMELKTVAVAGFSDKYKRIKDILHFNLNDQTWKPSPEKLEMVRGRRVVRFESLSAYIDNSVTEHSLKEFEAAFNLGFVYIIRISKEQTIIGDFTLLFERGKSLTNPEVAKLYADIVGLFLEKRKSEQKYRNLFEESNDALLINDKSGNIREVNRFACELFGYTREELLKKNILELTPEEYVERNKNALNEVSAEGRVRIDTIHKNKQGQLIEVSVNATLFEREKDLILASIRDIRRRKETENALKESEERFQAMLGVIPDMVSIQDSDMNIIYSNWNGFAAVERGKRQLNTKCYKTYRGFDSPCPDCKAKVVLKTGRPYHCETKLPNNRWYEIRVIPITFKGDHVELFVEWVRDISPRKLNETKERKNLETIKSINEKLEREKTKALAASKAKSEFLANMSHELRTPLNGVIGFSQLLENTPLNVEQKEYIDVIHSSGKTLLHIISDILDFSKIEAGKLELNEERIDLKLLLKNTVEIVYHNAVAKGIKLTESVPAELPRFVAVDPVRLKQILLNLLVNAVKFTEEGEVSFSVSCLNMNRKKKTIVLIFSIRDTGIGIKKENQKKIFEAFNQEDYSITRKFGGTGLGLSISNSLLHKMNSSLSLESEYGVGSNFFFELELPFDEHSEEEPIPTFSGEELKRLRNCNAKILIVEDDRFNRLLTKKILRSLSDKIEVVEAENGEQALEILQHKKICLVLMDLRMPKMDGYATTGRIRQFNQDIPIIAVTANVLKEERDKCLKAGMNDYLPKPFSHESLAGVIRKFL